MTIGEKINAMMKKKGLSQNRLAKSAQISQSGLSSIISGAVSPKEATLKAIAEVLECPAWELLKDVPEEYAPDPDEQKDERYEISELLRRDPDLRILFAQARNAKPEHIRAAAAMLKSLEGDRND